MAGDAGRGFDTGDGLGLVLVLCNSSASIFLSDRGRFRSGRLRLAPNFTRGGLSPARNARRQEP